MTAAPFVELQFNPTDLRPRDLPSAGAFLGTPANALEASLAVSRARMVDRMREDLRGLPEPSPSQLVQVADLAWQLVFHRFKVISAPAIADAYIRAYRKADAGDVPMSVIYALADKHVEKIGDYFHSTSRDALVQGFSTYVNRQLPAKAAVDRVLDAYGLTPRQMRGYTSAKQFQTPVDSPMPRSLKAKARAYIDRSFTTRTKRLSEQEEHNIAEQAKQYAWMWLREKNRLPEKAQKVWVTAKDERVCAVCGPLHNKRVGINERFKTAQGEFWSPGLHPNCRCRVRLLENRFAKALAGTALAEFNQEHPRAQAGRFGVKTRTRPVKTLDVDTEFEALIAAQPKGKLQPVDTATDVAFADLIAAQPIQATGFGGFGSPFAYTAPAAVEAPRTKVDAPSPEFKTELEQVVFQLTDPAVRNEFVVDLVMDTRAAVRADAQTKPDTRIKPPVTRLDTEVYAVIHRWHLHDGNIDRIHLDHGIQFSTDQMRISEEAADEISRQVEDTVMDLQAGEGRIEMVDEKSGKEYHAYIETQDIKDAIDWIARTATRHHHDPLDPDSTGDGRVEVRWYNEDGDYAGTEHLPYSYIGHELGVDQSEFETYMVRLDESHADPDSIEDVTGSAGSVHRGYSLEGWFELVPDSVNRTQSDHTYGVTSYKIQPSGIHEEFEDEE